MYRLPNFKNSFEYENDFYLSAKPSRLGKALAHYELFKLSLNVPGAIVECGVFKGASLSRFSILRNLFKLEHQKPIYGFDVFGAFPETDFEGDRDARKKFIDNAGSEGISVDDLYQSLKLRGLEENLCLIRGDIRKTLPTYVEENQDLEISFLNIDTDLYEPCVTALEKLYPLVSSGGVVLLDNYNVFPGETKAVDEYFGPNLDIRTLDLCKTPSFIVKD